MMADPVSILGAITGSMDLASSALRSVKALYELIRSYQDYPETVKYLEIELYGLLVALQKIKKLHLDKTTSSELKPILMACDKACSELRQAIEKCTSHSGGKERHLGDWAKMKFLDSNISVAKETLAGYKATIAIIINAVNLDTMQMTSEQLEEYKRTILETNSRLSSLLRLLGQRSPARTEDQDSIKEVQIAIRQCMSACSRVEDNIERVRKSLDDSLATCEPEKSTKPRKIRQNTSKAFDDVQKRISQLASQLQAMQEDARSQHEEEQYRACSIQHCISILEKRAEQAQGYSFENISCKPHALQIITSSSATNLSAKDVHVESYGSQIMGEHHSVTVEKLIENHDFRPRATLSVPRKRLLGFIPIRRHNVSEKP